MLDRYTMGLSQTVTFAKAFINRWILKRRWHKCEGNVKQLVISSYSDLDKASHSVRKIHFRKFVSKKLLEQLLLSCPELREVSFSRSAYSRLNGLGQELAMRGISVSVIQRPAGRPIRWR